MLVCRMFLMNFILFFQAKLKASNPDSEDLQDRIKPDTVNQSMVVMRN